MILASKSSARVAVNVSKAQPSTWTDKGGGVTVIEKINIEVVWGFKPTDRWQGQLVKHPVVLALLDKIKKRATPLSAKTYAAKLPKLEFLDYRFGACDRSVTAEDGNPYPCHNPIVLPGLDGYKCSACGWVFTGLTTITRTNTPTARKPKKVEQVPLPELPSSQMSLFSVAELQQEERAIAQVWATPSEDEAEQASLELIELYAED